MNADDAVSQSKILQETDTHTLPSEAHICLFGRRPWHGAWQVCPCAHVPTHSWREACKTIYNRWHAERQIECTEHGLDTVYKGFAVVHNCKLHDMTHGQCVPVGMFQDTAGEKCTRLSIIIYGTLKCRLSAPNMDSTLFRRILPSLTSANYTIYFPQNTNYLFLETWKYRSS